MRVELLTPAAGLAALLLVVPLVAALARERRLERVRTALGVGSPQRRARFAGALAGAGAVALLGLAAAQPAVGLAGGTAVRTDVDAYFVLDISRSMLAARAPDEPIRYERAQAAALELREALPGVPAGVVSMSDRALPHLFPTADVDPFAALVREAIAVERPPPSYSATLHATSLDDLSSLARDGALATGRRRHVVVALTDAETLPIGERQVVSALAAKKASLVLVHVWRPEERVFDGAGRPEVDYRPDPASLAVLRRFEQAGAHVFAETELEEARDAVRRLVGDGPAARATDERLVSLAPALALAAFLPLGFVLVRNHRSRS